MNIRIRLIGAALLMAALATASTTFTPLGWSYANVNGTSYSPGQTLPFSALFTTSGATSTGGIAAGQAANCAQGGTRSTTNFATYNAKYKVTTSAVPNTMAVLVSIHASTSADAIVYANGWYGAGQGGSYGLKTETAEQSIPGDNEGMDQDKDGSFLILLPSSIFTATSGSYSATFNIPLRPTFAAATVSGPGGGNFRIQAVQAGGGGGFSVTPSQKSVPSGGGGGGIITAFTQNYLDRVTVQVIQTLGGTVVDTYDSGNNLNGVSGFGILADSTYSPGTYAVYIKAPGSLRKKLSMTISTDGTMSLDTVDATLRFGDLDGDGYVSQAEVDYVHSKIGTNVMTTPLDPIGPGQPVGTLQPYMADLDGDGQVTQADYNLALASLGQSGD